MAQRLSEIFAKCMATPLRRIVALLLLLLFLFFLLILASPTILSSNFAQNRIKSTLSTTLHGPVEWSSLQLSWSQGLKLRNLTIGPATGMLQQASLAALDCEPDFGFGTEPGASFGFDVILHLHDLHLELAPAETTATPPSPPSATKGPDPLTALAQGLDRFATLSWPLPVDMRVDVEIDPVTIIYHDRASGRTLRFAQGGLQVRIPSLERAPLTLSLNGKVQVDDHELGPLRFATEITGLVAPSGRIVPAGALLSSFVEFPGIAIKADGRLTQEQGLNGELRLDLPELQRVAAPFLPTTLPKIAGTLQTILHAQVDKEENLALSCTVTGQKLRAAEVGPIDFDLGQQIRTDHRRQIVTLGGGILMIPQLLEAKWEASVEQPDSPERRVSARLQLLELNLDQALLLAAPLLPSGLPQLPGGRLYLRDLDLQLRGSQGAGEVRLARAEVVLPDLRFLQPQAEVTGAGIELVARDLILPLAAYFPTSVDTTIEWKIAGFQLRGAQLLTLQGLDGMGTLAIKDIRKAGEKGELSGNGSFNHQLHLKEAEVVALARITDLANNLHLAFSLLPGGGVNVEKVQFNSSLAAFTATVDGKKLAPLPISQNLQIEGVEIRPGGSLPLVKNVEFSISSPDLVKVEGQGSLTEERLLTLELQNRLDLRPLLTLAGPLLPEKLTATGTMTNQLQLVATLPDHPLATGEQPLRRAKNALALLKELSGSVQLDAVELHLPLQNGTLHVSGIQTSLPLSLRSSENGKKIDVSGALDFDLRAGSAINGQPLPSEHGQVAFNGELRDWDRAFFAQNVQLERLGVAEHSEWTITRLASLLDAALPPPPATLLQRLDATVFAEVDVNLRPAAPSLLPDLTMSGKTNVGTRIDLRGGDSLRLHAYADAENLAVNIAKGPQLQGLQAHFNLERSLQISSAATHQQRWRPLSTSLVQPLPLALPPPLAGERRRLLDDLRGNSSGDRSLRIAALTLPQSPLPLTIQALEAEIATGQEELGMNFLQAELLGGTLRARALVDLRPPVPVVTAEALFTNLDLARLGSTGATPLRPGEAESSISGEGSLSVPLLTEERPLLEGLTVQGSLRRIGSKTFDRALAWLDPYERNEAIMSQRKMLRLGQLQGIEVQVADGAFALTGAVSAKGVTLALPKIDRLRLADLSLQKELAPALQAISMARNALEFARADTINIGAQGEISLRKEEQ